MNNQRTEIDRLKKIIAEQQATIQELNGAMEGMRNSTSWKLTAPIRGAKNVIKRMTGKEAAKDMAVPPAKEGEDIEESVNEVLEVSHVSSELSEEDLRSYVDYVMQIPFTGDGDRYEEKSCLRTEIGEEDIKYIAFYLPQFHAFPENDAWWGKGFTEWTNVTKAIPQFQGHYQPRLAGELGYYDLSDGRKIEEQIKLAKQFGLYGFCIYYYWFDGKKLMETPLNYILEHPDLEFPFCICWANENWSRRWDGKEADILIQQNYDDDFPERFISDACVYLRDRRYIRVDGKPLLVIYNPNQIPDLKRTIEYWREYCRTNGIGEICLAAVDFALTEESRHAGFDRFIQFPPHATYFYDKKKLNEQLQVIDKDFQGEIYDYQDIVNNKEYLKDDYSDMYPGVFLGWDNTARKKNNATIYHNYSPEALKEWLLDVSNIAMHKQPSDRIVFINAWNEWAEGTYLEPDRCYGYAALNAVQACLMEARKASETKKIIYVSHDAWFNGAQMLALNTINYLSEVLGYKVYVVVKETGELEADFREFAEQYVIYSDFSNACEFENWILSTGCSAALCNTVISGDLVPIFKRLGLTTVTSIHEMENVIHQYNSEENLRCIIENSDKIVFPSKYVIDSVSRIQALPEDKTIIMHQGMFLVNPYLETRKAVGQELRKLHGIAENDTVILGVGYGYKRKGLDLFVKAGLKLCEEYSQLKLMWVGDLEETMEQEIHALLDGNVYKDRFVFAGNRKDLMRYYCSADLFWLTSREDPFPSVVMEAMYSYLPIVAFQNGGGYVEVVREDTGALVTMESVDELVEETKRMLDHEELAQSMGKAAHEFAEQEFDFGKYAVNLLRLAGEQLPKVSVIVPNYNYEKYLSIRIDSVLNQTYPIHEIILLDDCSTDRSTDIIDAYCLKYPDKIRSIKNKTNSGNVFEQWRKGIEACSGDYIWIAEADDLCDNNMLSQLMKKFMDDDSVIMAYSQSEMIDENGNKLGDNYFCYTDDIDPEIWRSDYVIDAKREISEHLAVKNTIPNVSAVLFKRMDFGDILTEAKHYKVAGDWYVYFRVMSCGGKVAYCAESMNKHRRHTNSVTSDLKLETHFKEICDMQDIIAERYNAGQLSDKAKEYREKVRRDFGLIREE